MDEAIAQENKIMKKALNFATIMVEIQQKVIEISDENAGLLYENVQLMGQVEDNARLINRLEKEVGQERFKQILESLNLEFDEDQPMFMDEMTDDLGRQ